MESKGAKQPRLNLSTGGVLFDAGSSPALMPAHLRRSQVLYETNNWSFFGVFFGNYCLIHGIEGQGHLYGQICFCVIVCRLLTVMSWKRHQNNFPVLLVTDGL